MDVSRKRLVLVLLVVFGLFGPATGEKVSSMPAPTGYIDDYAGVMTPAGKADVDRICHEIHLKTKAQIFVVTIKTLDGESVQMFASDLYHQWKIGEKKTDRGVLLLLAVSEHKWRIEVGYGLEGVLNDAKVGRIGREMVPSLKANDYDGAAHTAVEELAQDIAADANVTLDQPVRTAPAVVAPPAPRQSHGSFGFGALLLLLFLPVIVLFLMFMAMIRRWRRRIMGPGYYENPVQPGVFYGGSGFDSPGNDSGSGFSSGSDSSSSDSFSGGDGGDSGGGGADGGW